MRRILRLFQTHPPPHRRGERYRCRPTGTERHVSIHPPLIGEGNRASRPREAPGGVPIHPPPHRRGEPTTSSGITPLAQFQSTPASSARGTRLLPSPRRLGRVSIHPPPHRRGERIRRGRGHRASRRFNPPPASSARGTRKRPMWRVIEDPVSIHPPPHRRGEHEPRFIRPFRRSFQSTPRLIGEGNPAVSCTARYSPGFNPPPASSARGSGQ